MNSAANRYLVCGNQAFMDAEVSAVHYVHKRFKMANAVILPLIQLCASSVIAMGLAGKLLNEHEYMLIVSAKRCPI